eukprot:scaffold252255_cov32-Tisochrysis_lutea.AAC.4
MEAQRANAVAQSRGERESARAHDALGANAVAQSQGERGFDGDFPSGGVDIIATSDPRGRAFFSVGEEPVLLRNGKASVTGVQADIRE